MCLPQWQKVRKMVGQFAMEILNEESQASGVLTMSPEHTLPANLSLYSMSHV